MGYRSATGILELSIVIRIQTTEKVQRKNVIHHSVFEPFSKNSELTFGKAKVWMQLDPAKVRQLQPISFLI